MSTCNVCGDPTNGTRGCVRYVSCRNYPESSASFVDPACDGCGVLQSMMPEDEERLWVIVWSGTARNMNRTELCASCACTDRSEGL